MVILELFNITNPSAEGHLEPIQIHLSQGVAGF